MGTSTNVRELMIERIQEVYDKIDRKGDFAMKVAERLGKSFDYVRQNYLQSGWKIPEKDQQTVLDMALEWIRGQKSELEKVIKG